MPNKESNHKPAPASGDTWLGAFLLAVAGTVLVLSQSIHAIGLGDNSDPGSKVFPIGLSLLLAAGGLVELWRSRNRIKPAMPDRGGPPPSPATAIAPDGSGRLVLLLLACFAVYVILLPWLGFALTTLLMGTGMMVLLGNSWKLSVLIAAILIILVYILFVLLFKVPLPGGIFNLPF